MKTLVLIYPQYKDYNNGKPLIRRIAVRSTVIDRDVDFQLRQHTINKMNSSLKTDFVRKWISDIRRSQRWATNKFKTA
ncbi:hypothetical protein D3C72_1981540 [compost metagenome]